MKRVSLNKVMAKLADQPQKVELNMIKDIESDSSKANSIYESAVKRTFVAIKEINSAIQDMERVVKLSQGVITKGKEVEKLADNIGADLKSSTTKAIQDAFNVQQAAEQNLKDLNKAKQVIQ